MKFISHQETLINSLSHITNFAQAISLLRYLQVKYGIPDMLDQEILKFFQEIVIARHSAEAKQQISSGNMNSVLQKHLIELLASRKNQYVQVLGLSLIQNELSLKMTSLNLARNQLQNLGFSWIFQNLGKQIYIDLLQNHYIFKWKKQGFYMQIAGPSIIELLNNKINIKQPTISKGNFNIQELKINRFQMLYCKHMARIPGLFHHHPFFISKNLGFQFYLFVMGRPAQKISPTIENNGLLLLQQAHNQLKKIISISQIIKLEQIYKQLQINTKKLVQLRPTKKIRTNRFTILLSKYCRLPSNYKNLKIDITRALKGQIEITQNLFDQLYSNNIPYKKMAAFLRAILDSIVPQRLYDQQMYNRISSMMIHLISRKRFQGIKVQQLLDKWCLFKIPWAKVNYNKKWQKIIKARYKIVLANTVTYLFNQLLIPIIRFNFFVTQRHKQNNKLYYYRKQIWQLISKMAIKRFSNQNLAPLQSKKLLQPIAQGKLRIMPKVGSFRPIITFNKKIKSKAGKNYNLNQKMFDARLVLRNLKSKLAEEGLCVFDNDQVFQKMSRFTKLWRLKNKPKLWFFTLDIKKCYDSINTQLLSQIIQQDPIFKKYFLINRYTYIYRNKKGISQSQIKPFSQYFNSKQRFVAISLQQLYTPFQQKQSDRPSIIVPSGKVRSASGKQIAKKLIQICCGTCAVQYNGKRYKQIHGIPQGLNVSGVLCSLYFHYIQEKYKIGYFEQEGLSLLMRLTDDYFFIGESLECAKKVLNKLRQAAKVFGFQFNRDKMQSNLQEQQIENVIWIGKSININTLQVLPAYDSDLSKLAYSMNVNIAGKKAIFSILKNKLKSLLTNHFASGFDSSLHQKISLFKQVEVLVFLSLHKFQPFIDQVLRTKTNFTCAHIWKSMISTFTQFALFVCYLWKKRNQVTNNLYRQILLVVLGQSNLFLKNRKKKNNTYSKLQYFCNRKMGRTLLQIKSQLQIQQ